MKMDRLLADIEKRASDPNRYPAEARADIVSLLEYVRELRATLAMRETGGQ